MARIILRVLLFLPLGIGRLILVVWVLPSALILALLFRVSETGILLVFVLLVADGLIFLPPFAPLAARWALPNGGCLGLGCCPGYRLTPLAVIRQPGSLSEDLALIAAWKPRFVLSLMEEDDLASVGAPVKVLADDLAALGVELVASMVRIGIVRIELQCPREFLFSLLEPPFILQNCCPHPMAP